MVRFLRFGLALLLAAAAAEAQDVRAAKSYLRTVKKHLLESYIDCEKLDSDELERAALKALGEAVGHKDFRDLDAETRRAVRDAVDGEKTAAGAVEAAADAAGEADFDVLRFADHAASAMVRSTGDPYSRILDADLFQKLLRVIQGRGREDYLGIYAVVKEGRAEVAFVEYGYPAYEEGVRVGYELRAIDGRPVGSDPIEINESLLVPPGEMIELTMRRRGIDRDLVFRIRQTDYRPGNVHHRLLRGGIGYLRMTIFDNSLVRSARRALRGMKEEGMRAVIVDLRNNPGGALPACTGAVDLFLGQGLTIARTVSHYEPSFGGIKLPGFKESYVTKAPSEFEEIPMVLLINGSSASASEMFAGAIRDHRRATLVGERTYGKGVGQSVIFLPSVFMKRYLYLTVMRYRTPLGDEVDHRGVRPSIEFPEEEEDAATFLAAWEMRRSRGLRNYLRRNAAELEELAEYDAFDASRYPGFDDFYASLETKLSRDRVRQEIRRAVRRRVAGERDAPYVCDLQTDLQLQQAVVTLLDQLGDE